MHRPLLRAQPERTAWIVVWSSFAILCLLVILVPLGVRAVLLYSTQPRPATLQTLEGTVLVRNASTGRRDPITRGQTATVGEGDEIILDENSECDIRFFDGSYVHVRPGSHLSLERMRAPRFSTGVRPNMIWMEMPEGRMRLVTSGPTRPSGLDYLLRLPHLSAEVAVHGDGVFGAEVQSHVADFWAHLGSAVVTANGKSVQLLAPERTTIEPGRQPVAPIAYARELLVNGDFGKPLTSGWAVFNDQGSDGGEVNGVWTFDERSHAVRFFRTGSQRNHCETGIEQAVNRDLPDPVSSLVVRANVRVAYQGLSGGGYQASEYPLMIRLKYRDKYGSENEWVQGFYYENKDNNPTVNGKLIPQDAWYYFESGNLLETLRPTPFRIVSLKVYASGWDYESLISYISVAVQ